MNYLGIITGILALIIIGIWHPIVIKGEYYLGKKKCTYIFALTGILCIITSLLIENQYLNIIIAFFGCSSFWGIIEVHQQEKRVQKGWFPKNNKK